MKQINTVEVERLYALANMLDGVQENQFDLRSWITQAPRLRTTKLFGLVESDPGCGFAGCAMGWAAYTQIFPGLHLSRGGDIYYDNHSDWDAVMALLGISRNMAVFLFSTAYYQHLTVTPTEVANRVRRFAGKIEAIRRRPTTDISALVKLTKPKAKFNEVVVSLS